MTALGMGSGESLPKGNHEKDKNDQQYLDGDITLTHSLNYLDSGGTISSLLHLELKLSRISMNFQHLRFDSYSSVIIDH